MITRLAAALLLVLSLSACQQGPTQSASLGPRPAYLVDTMPEGGLRSRLEACLTRPQPLNRFSIGHRGAPLQFPEHTRESYLAAARMGAGIVECDVSFTGDRQLVCRHSRCDLHETTDILARPALANQCSAPFVPADPLTGESATARCCTSDITLAQFLSLCGRMKGTNPAAATIEEYLTGTPGWRTQLYDQCGQLMSLSDSIALNRTLGVAHIPEAKAHGEDYDGDYDRTAFLDDLVKAYREEGVPSTEVWLQSSDYNDIRYWLANAGEYAGRVVYLDNRPWRTPGYQPSLDDFRRMKQDGLYAVAPPLPVLLTTRDGAIVASAYARLAREAGLDLLTWTVERSGPLADARGSFYLATYSDAVHGDGDVYEILRVLVEEAGVVGVFSDWPATTTLLANCLALDGPS